MIRDTFEFMNDTIEKGSAEPASSDMIELAMVLHHDTGKAVLVSSDGEEFRAVWIPHSRCSVDHSGRQVTGHRKNGQAVKLQAVTVTLTAAVAEEKGLV